MKDNCLFCSNTLDGSNEHIIPDSLNGRLQSRKLICKSCNRKFGIHLDPILKEVLHMQLYFLGFANAQYFAIKDDQGNIYRADQKGQIIPQQVLTKNIQENGLEGISVSGPMEKAIQAMLKKMVRNYGVEETLMAAKSGNIKIQEKSKVPNELVAENPLIITPKLKLAVEKIMIEYYAFCGLELSYIESRLKRIYALDEQSEEVIICNLTQEIRKPVDNEISHLICIRSNEDRKELYVYLELFNVVCAYTLISSQYEGVQVNYTYYQNALTGVPMTNIPELNISNLSEGDENLEFLANDMVERKLDGDIMAMLEQDLTKMINDLKDRRSKGQVSDEEHGNLVMKKAAEISAYFTINYPDQFTGLSTDFIAKTNYIYSTIFADQTDQFQAHYKGLIGQEFTIENDKRKWILKRFHFVLAKERDGRDRRKVYCHFQSVKGEHEKEILCLNVFRARGLEMPKGVSWL
ncbi:hypothetical protein ASU31_00900 [Pedobacter ginsenosidimutans]|uniref:HNH endonuclease 5 domain-containing protein n=1 Tax=Pedobacter ginsenosidimutans TaxID=687842 RepID=A0A0T5VVJ5_9SPHI|nr:HNH endonuclease [Pedobacter ginsenosidimutans]KRT17884.1 hypothetical protein ASU31_00900 [Pedobacter ginsenosidimutans]